MKATTKAIGFTLPTAKQPGQLAVGKVDRLFKALTRNYAGVEYAPETPEVPPTSGVSGP